MSFHSLLSVRVTVSLFSQQVKINKCVRKHDIIFFIRNMDSQQNTTGLEDRIAKLATATELPDFPDDKSDLPSDFEYNPEDYEEEEEVEEITEAELLKYLDSQEKALNVCQRLFYHELNTTKSQENSSSWNLKCLSAEAIEELYAQGWTELEGTMIDLDILKGTLFAYKGRD
jgi:hypothetical protein